MKGLGGSRVLLGGRVTIQRRHRMTIDSYMLPCRWFDEPDGVHWCAQHGSTSPCHKYERLIEKWRSQGETERTIRKRMKEMGR